MRLVSNVEVIQATYGLDPVAQLLFTNIRLDSRRMVTPLLAETKSGRFLMARQQEMGNLLSSGLEQKDLKFYEPWVTIDESITAGVPVFPKFADTVEALAQGDSVQFDDGIPLIHYRALQDRVTVTFPDVPVQKVRAYALNTADILAKFSTIRESGVTSARSLIKGIEHLNGLESDLVSNVDTRFSGLETLADTLNLDGFLLASPPNFSEVTGYKSDENTMALWNRGSNTVIIIAASDKTDVPGTPLGLFDSAAHALGSLRTGPTKRLGIEEQWISARLGLDIEGQGLETENASIALGHWRDIRDHEDLPFQVIAARASVTCIEIALDYAQAQISSGNALTENDVYAIYLNAIQEFRAENNIPFCIEPYFTNLHSSSRMLFPGPPTDFPLDEETRCIQLDAGVKITVDGIVVATSDMARSLLLTPEGKEAYDLLTQIMREDIVGQLRPGVVCSDVHAHTMTALTNNRSRLEELGLLSPEVDFVAEYKKRNVGHLMGKQESFANELRPGYDHVLHVGSLGAAEIPWRFNGYAIGTEDMWYIAEDKTFLLTVL